MMGNRPEEIIRTAEEEGEEIYLLNREHTHSSPLGRKADEREENGRNKEK
jgi:hypothetical protein